MNCVKLGQERDRRILDLIARYGAATAEEVAAIYCHGNKAIARLRLLKLFKRGKLKRFALDRNGSWIYHSRPRSAKTEHHLEVLRTYVRFREGRPKDWRLDDNPEYVCGKVQTDLLAVLTGPGKRLAVFIERDRASDGHPWKKFKTYKELRESGDYKASPWYPATVRVVVVTEAGRVEALRRKAQEEVPDMRFLIISEREVSGLWSLLL